MSTTPATGTKANRSITVGDISSFLWANKRWWLAPILGGLLIFGVVMALARSSVIAPWNFSLF